MACVGLYASVSYGGELYCKTPDMSGSVLPLDPIDVAGKANLVHLKHLATQLDARFGHTALSWLKDITPLWKNGEPAELNDHRPTPEKYEQHLEDLSRWGVLEGLVGTSNLKFISGYFAVPKDKMWSRSVFNGKLLSRLFLPPPPVNIPAVPDIFELLKTLIVQQRRWYGYTSDIRHWFHQVRIGSGLQPFMGLHTKKGGYYKYKVLPMGWSYSPRICQCLAWLVLLATPKTPRGQAPNPNADGLEVARREARQQEHPPKFVLLRNANGEAIGFMTLTYDNICIWCGDKDIRDALQSKIEDTMRHCNITLKVAKSVDHEQLILESEDFVGLTHLGIQYGLRQNGERFLPVWRLDPDRIERYEEVADRLCSTQDLSRREIARTIGIIIWSLTVVERPLCYATTLIKILRSLTSGLATMTRKHWDAIFPLDLSHRNYLGTMLSEVLRNEWHYAEAELRHKKGITIFTDASQSCMGAVFISDAGTPVPDSVPFHPSLLPVHIFLKELTALVWFTVKALRQNNVENAHLRLVTDNSAVFFAVRNLYSSNEYANRWLQFLHRELTRRKCSWSVHQVISEDNPADGPSRFENAVCPTRLRAGLSSVAASENGIAKSSTTRKAFRSREETNPNSLRHHDESHALREPSDAESVDEEEDELGMQIEELLEGHCTGVAAPREAELLRWFGICKSP